MCFIADSDNLPANQWTGGIIKLLKDQIVQNVGPESFKLRCRHPDGRSETYLLVPGKKLVADEKAEIEVLEKYPTEVPSLHPEEKPVPVGSHE